ncbi:MAG: grasp-with-spasm system SPASM domain peptide maturase [Chryseotalea sp. WA131a]|jgi:SPASM domain peptide maturase of grasp-with-spasm system|nr:MAG: grasp-with-spasm system SPASM domain peptide maturase [Chryseotalea sp. WA131a]
MMSKAETWFKLFASCVIVKGIAGSLIYDIERSTFYDLPNSFLEIIKSSTSKNIRDIEIHFGLESSEIKSFFDKLVDAEIGFYTDEPDSFPEIDFTWYSPLQITNSIIELDSNSQFNFDFENIILQLNSLGCRAIQLRLLSVFDYIELERLIVIFSDTRIKHIELMVPFCVNVSFENLYNLMKHEARLNRIMIYASSEDGIIINEDKLGKSILQFKKDIRADQHEIISAGLFNSNIESFSEAQGYNLGLNRKICINKSGEIKNYLNHEYSYGNVKNDSIKEIIETSYFKVKWSISNDQIEICKDCKYRYTCVSNSDIRMENDKFFKVNYCNFNPYTDEWICEIIALN